MGIAFLSVWNLCACFWWYCFFISPTVMLATVFIYYFLRKWLITRYRENMFTMDDAGLNPKNSYMPILWSDIEAVTYKAGKLGNIVGIKLKASNVYAHQKLPMLTVIRLKASKIMYGYDFCISALAPKDGPTQVYNTINDGLIRTKLIKAGWSFWLF